jgi:hypothetical protein
LLLIVAIPFFSAIRGDPKTPPKKLQKNHLGAQIETKSTYIPNANAAFFYTGGAHPPNPKYQIGDRGYTIYKPIGAVAVALPPPRRHTAATLPPRPAAPTPNTPAHMAHANGPPVCYVFAAALPAKPTGAANGVDGRASFAGFLPLESLVVVSEEAIGRWWW